jgi:hypothetical protein
MVVICPTMKGNQSLCSNIAALHLVYKTTEVQVLLFGQLVSCWPSVICDIKSVLPHEESTVIVSCVPQCTTVSNIIFLLTSGTSTVCCQVCHEATRPPIGD